MCGTWIFSFHFVQPNETVNGIFFPFTCEEAETGRISVVKFPGSHSWQSSIQVCLLHPPGPTPLHLQMWSMVVGMFTDIAELLKFTDSQIHRPHSRNVIQCISGRGQWSVLAETSQVILMGNSDIVATSLAGAFLSKSPSRALLTFQCPSQCPGC